jgi:hypothetical protein
MRLRCIKVDPFSFCFPLPSLTQGVGCARRGYPGVYSRISGAIDWIEDQICTLSQNPPPRCGRIPSGSDIRIRIDIRHDDWPTDTSWELRNSTGTVVAGSPTGSVQKKQTLVSTFVDISPGTYIFRIFDSWGDGLTVGDREGM